MHLKFHFTVVTQFVLVLLIFQRNAWSSCLNQASVNLNWSCSKGERSTQTPTPCLLLLLLLPSFHLNINWHPNCAPPPCRNERLVLPPPGDPEMVRISLPPVAIKIVLLLECDPAWFNWCWKMMNRWKFFQPEMMEIRSVQWITPQFCSAHW